MTIEHINKFIIKCDGCKKVIMEISGDNLTMGIKDDSMIYCYEGCEYGNWIIQQEQEKITNLGLNLYKMEKRK